ncbi:hypothetical protein HN419_05260 [Candidatus Woesearchaeota archaeon]|jgi:hypothetical protein|nr:hypothetical protein [Candidatus Woesearchaeota archaeon]MBT3537720.1 hypothetical protein [Candidatus Woesearchaeota archaeon]MBT4697851.1 hypothetical protein [Candidatus Woesearchaeota archaeon]MBT4717489.1 hypothetical protein [Candidatus Woesearchaeota archaeon]MBT7105389.1 hypothetical protein [Candidatus Woesearchaeota archaeon]
MEIEELIWLESSMESVKLSELIADGCKVPESMKKIHARERTTMEIGIKMEEINWSEFSGQFVRLEENEPTDVVLTNWKQVQKDFNGETQQGIEFDVVELNGTEVQRSLQTFSKRLIMALKSLVENAEKLGNKSFKARITKTGQAFKTNYAVKPL